MKVKGEDYPIYEMEIKNMKPPVVVWHVWNCGSKSNTHDNIGSFWKQHETTILCLWYKQLGKSQKKT